MGNDASAPVTYGERIKNDIKVEWIKLSGQNVFEKRDGHVACVVGKQLYVFGGIVKKEDTEFTESDDLFLFNLDTQNWIKVEVTGDLPAGRSAGTLSSVGNKLYLFGGLSNSSGWFNDLSIFDTETKTWLKADTDGEAPSPSPRDKLTSVAIGKYIYFFGGFGPKSSAEKACEIVDVDDEVEDDDLEESQEAAEFVWFNEIHKFDTETKTWSKVAQSNPEKAPTPRAAHGMCSVGKSLVIFGGRDQKGRRNDLHIFNTDTRQWEDTKIKGRQAEPRSFHSLTSCDHRVVVLGGRSVDNKHFSDLHIYDTESHEWLQPDITGCLPAARGLHTASVVGDRLVVVGGSSDFSGETMQCLTYHNDVFFINTADILNGGSCHHEENQENVPSTANVPQEENSHPKGTVTMETNVSALVN